jgi:hypothetical protein
MVPLTRHDSGVRQNLLGNVERQLELEALRTQVAKQAASLAQAVTDGFDGFHMGAGDCIVELMAPEGQSTADGAQARQNIRLVPRRKGYSVVVVGTVDPVARTAEVRTYAHVAILHEIRFGYPIEITAEEYANFLAKLDIVLNLARIRSRRVYPPAELVAQQEARSKSSTASVLVFLAVLTIAALIVYRVMRGGPF